MRRSRLILIFCTALIALLVLAGPAFATTYGGEGIYGQTDDAQITNAMFFLLGAIPVFIILMSGLMMWGEHRRHKKQAAEKARRAAEPAQGGW